MKKLVLDASVIVERIIESAPHRDKVTKLFEKALAGEVDLYATPIALSEVLYVASRVYEAAGLSDPNGEALNYALWVNGRTKTIELDENLAFRAGELKKRLGIALPDCYVIAAAEKVKATPLFREIETEMSSILPELKRLGATFLNEL